MTKAIQQSVKFQASPKELFEIYLDSKKHSEATGAPARLSRKAGGSFTAHGGQLCGRNLLIIPKQADRASLAGTAVESIRPGFDSDPQLQQNERWRANRYGPREHAALRSRGRH